MDGVAAASTLEMCARRRAQSLVENVVDEGS